MAKRISVILSVTICFSIFVFYAKVVLADEVILENGDKLTGTVVKVEGRKLTLKTDCSKQA